MLQTLFEMPSPVMPEGFNYYPSFISQDEEQQLLGCIEKSDLRNMRFHQYEAKRKVISYGKGWSFTEQQLKQGDPIPAAFDFLVEKIATKLSIDKQLIVQFLITQYPVGSVINWHRDAPPFDTIAGVSLLTDCKFKLRPHDKEKQTRSATINLNVERCSLYTMQGIAKNEWQHSTALNDKIRYSLTFRTLKNHGP